MKLSTSSYGWIGASLLALGAGAAAYSLWASGQPARLLAQAYVEQRPFLYRIPQAGHAPLRVEKRPRSSFLRPGTLIQAEARIAANLNNNPTQTEWLALRATAEMLESDPDAAIASLRRALEQKPEDHSLLASLGMAYALRAESAHRAVDYGEAIEYLSRALKGGKESETLEAAFNLAIVYERVFLFSGAVEEWRRYLERDPSGAWADEARNRLAAVEHRIASRKEALERITADTSAFLNRVRRGEDVDPEAYLDIAMIRWLPRHVENGPHTEALQALAGLFLRHGDRWLSDVLAAQPSHSLHLGLSGLAAAIEAYRNGQTDDAVEKARRAAAQLRAAGSPAAALRAETEQIYALRRSVRGRECLNLAPVTARSAAAAGYPWIVAQIGIELGSCRGITGDSGGGLADLLRSLDLARASGFKELAMRAESILAGSQIGAGNLLTAWDRGLVALDQFWRGAYSRSRAQQIYVNLMVASERLSLPHAAYAFSRAGVDVISGTPFRLMEAIARVQLSGLAARTGNLTEAQAQYKLAEQLFPAADRTTAGVQNRLFAEMDLAETELALQQPAVALARLERIREQVRNTEAERVKLRASQAAGEALARLNRETEAGHEYHAAIGWCERRVDSLKTIEDKAVSARLAAKAYRGLAGIYWTRDSDAKKAFTLWDRYLGEESLQPRDQRRLDLSSLRNETVLAYAMLPGGMVVWALSDLGIESRRIEATPVQMEQAAQRFLRLCADPASNREVLHQEARRLYDWLIAPVAHSLDPARSLVVIPDGPMAAIPLAALRDADSRYLGERFPITVATGVADYLRRKAAAPVTSASRALVVANPTLGTEMQRAFPPLPQAAREGHLVSGRFPQAVVLEGPGATMDALEHHRSGTEVLHFAGHGFSNSGNGGLLLAGVRIAGEGSPPLPEVLEGRRLAGADWSRCRLAVLSACSAGTGETRGAVNPESLVRRLLWAGAARVVASRWNVDAETSVGMMDRFYSALLSGMDVAAALQQAARSLRSQTDTTHPYFWAGFQTFGSR